MRFKPLLPAGLLKRIAEGRGNALPLIVPVDIQPVQIAAAVHVAKADNLSILLRHQRMVGGKALVPPLQIRLPGGPGIQLRRRIVPGIHRVHRVVKQRGQPRAVVRLIGPDAPFLRFVFKLHFHPPCAAIIPHTGSGGQHAGRGQPAAPACFLRRGGAAQFHPGIVHRCIENNRGLCRRLDANCINLHILTQAPNQQLRRRNRAPCL